MKKTLLAITVVCLVIAVLSPIVSYIYFSDRLSDVSESYEMQISELQNSMLLQINRDLKGKIANYVRMKPFDPYLTDPYLFTDLGWYLHNSSDPILASRNKLTVYGIVRNVGVETAYNSKLIVYFYGNNAVLQKSEVNMGAINYWEYNYIKRDIDCESADNVTRIEVERTWENLP